MKKMFMLLTAGAAAMTATGASAGTVVYAIGAGPNSGATYSTFNNRTLGNTTQTTGTGITVSFTGNGAFVQGSVGGQYAAPVVANGSGANFGGQPDGADATTYVSSGTGSATLSFATPMTYLGLLWGSIDSYNTLTFNFADGTSQAIKGSVFGVLADAGQSRYVNFNATSAITSIVATSSINSFEFDNVAFGSAVPEAATWAMMMVGLGVVGGSLRRRRVSARVRFA